MQRIGCHSDKIKAHPRTSPCSLRKVVSEVIKRDDNALLTVLALKSHQISSLEPQLVRKRLYVFSIIQKVG